MHSRHKLYECLESRKTNSLNSDITILIYIHTDKRLIWMFRMWEGHLPIIMLVLNTIFETRATTYECLEYGK